MPELPEVETTLRGIEPFTLGKIIRKVDVRTPKLRWPVQKNLTQKLRDKEVLSLTRRAKYILLGFDNGSLIIHLGMTGSIKVMAVGIPPKKHEHIDVCFTDEICLRYTDPRKFGAFIWTSKQDPLNEHQLLRGLGPEPLSPQFNGDYLWHSCHNRTTSIKTHLMNQKTVVGVGNIYASEALFKAGIHPERRASRISHERLNKLVKTTKQTLRAAIKKGGTTLKDFSSPDGSSGYFSIKLNVYGKEGKPCPKCRKPIMAKVIGQRNSFYCSNCQK